VPFSLPTWQKCYYHSLGELPYAETPGNERIQGREGERVCLIRYVVFICICRMRFYIVLQINTSSMQFSQLLVSTISVNEDNVLIIVTAVDAGFRLI